MRVASPIAVVPPEHRSPQHDSTSQQANDVGGKHRRPIVNPSRPGGYNNLLHGGAKRSRFRVFDATPLSDVSVRTTLRMTLTFEDAEQRDARRLLRHCAFCMEPSHFPDSPNQPSFPSTVLAGGATHCGEIVYELGIGP